MKKQQIKKIFIKGGLGNQLFQLSYIYNNYYARGIQIVINTSSLGKYTHVDKRIFELDQVLKVLNINQEDAMEPISETISKIYSKFFSETFTPFALNGYFQDSFTFNLDLKQILSSVLLGNIEYNNSALIHIRGGDFRNVIKDYESRNDFFIEKAKKYIHQNDSDNIFYTSDDLDFAKNVIERHNIKASQIDIEFSDFSRFKSVISMNSSFSWWGSYLANSKLFSSKDNLGFRKWPKHPNETII